jgi:hypothetical protein
MLKQILWDYRFIIVLVVAAALFCLFEWQRTKTIAYSLMLQAKSLAKDSVLKSGDAQMEWVIKKAFQFLPKSITIFISEENLRKLIQYLYSKAKDYLDDGKINSSI